MRSLSLESLCVLLLCLNLTRRRLGDILVLINFLETNVLINLLGQLDSSHLSNGDGTFAINPFALNDVFVLELHNSMNTANVVVGYKAKTSWLLCPLVL